MLGPLTTWLWPFEPSTFARGADYGAYTGKHVSCRLEESDYGDETLLSSVLIALFKLRDLFIYRLGC
jgi:hypothetical protein